MEDPNQLEDVKKSEAKNEQNSNCKTSKQKNILNNNNSKPNNNKTSDQKNKSNNIVNNKPSIINKPNNKGRAPEASCRMNFLYQVSKSFTKIKIKIFFLTEFSFSLNWLSNFPM